MRLFIFCDELRGRKRLCSFTIGRLDAIPGSPSFSFWMSIAFYACFIVGFYYREKHPNQLSVYDKVTIIEILLMLVIFQFLHSSYNGLILLVFADIFTVLRNLTPPKIGNIGFLYRFELLVCCSYPTMT